MVHKSRNTTVDFLKIIAAFGVIAIHVHSDSPASRDVNKIFWPLCVPFFYAVSVAFFISGSQNNSLKNILTKTWQRIIIPYLIWLTIYVGLLFVKSVLVHGDRNFVFWRAIFYGEYSLHLYYIPTLLMYQAFALAIILFFNKQSRNIVSGVIIFTIALIYLIVGDVNNCFGVSASGQIFGIAFFLTAAFWAAPLLKSSKNQWQYVAFGSVLVVFAIVSNWFGYRYPVLSYPLLFPIGGIGLLFVAVGFPCIKLPNWFILLSSTSYGIYLSHVLFLEAFEFVIEKKVNVGLYVDLPLKMIIVTGIFISAAAFTLVTRKLYLGKTLLLGEK